MKYFLKIPACLFILIACSSASEKSSDHIGSVRQAGYHVNKHSEAGTSGAQLASTQANIIVMSIIPDMMKFDKETFTVTAGENVIIELENPDGMQHNMLIIKPGTLEKVGAAADALARDPKGAQLQYVPQIPEVLHATKMLLPNEVVTLTFTAPSEPGDYPFVCTFPGHWRMMNGIMKVTE